MVKGAFDKDIGVCYNGIMTNKWIIIGGLPYNTEGDGISFDKKYLPHADQLSDIIEALGVDTSGLSEAGWSSTQEEWEGLANGLTDGRPGNAFGSAVDNFQDILINGLNALGKGTSDLIDGLNRDYEEYWANITAGIQTSGGVIHEDGAGGDGGTGDTEKKDNSDSKFTDMVLGGIVGYFVGKTLDKVFSRATGVLLVPESFFDDWNTPGGAGGGTTAPDSDDGEVNEGNTLIGGWKGLKPIHVEDPSKKGSGIKVVQTDTGVIMVVDYDQLSDAMATGPEEGMRIGFNPLTGETINIIPGEVDPKARFGQLLRQWYLNRIVNPRR